MPWHKRDKALTQARRYVALLTDTFTPMPAYTRTRMSEQARAATKAEWAEEVRTTAQAYVDVIGPDPQAAEHWALLKEVVG